MRKLLFFGLVFSAVLTSCGGNSGVDDDANKNLTDSLNFVDMNAISLKEHGLNMILMLPEVASSTGASIEPKVDHDQGDYIWKISIGARFELIIEDYGKETAKVANEKKRLKDLSNIFDIEILLDETNLIMYKRTLHEGKGGKPSYHCYGETNIDGFTYVLRSNDEGALKPIIEDMVTTIRSANTVPNV